MKLIRTLTICLALALAPTTAWAHSGGTDSDGCHTDSSTDLRHCHSSGGGGGGNSRKKDALIIVGTLAFVALSLGFAAWAAEAKLAELSESEPTPEAPEDDELVWGVDGWADEDSGGVILQVQW